MTEFSSETDGSEPDSRGQPSTNTDEELESDRGAPRWSSDKAPPPSAGGPGGIPGRGTRSHVP